MKDSKHTPAPWKISKEPFVDLVVHEINGKIESICQLSRRYKTDAEIEANAKLIASAPELLEYLIKLRSWAISKGIDVEGLLMVNVDKTIKKATE